MKATFNSSYNEVFKACISVLDKLDILVEYSNKSKGIIQGKTRSTILSWGEEIELFINKKGIKTVVKVKSDASAQLISWGKNSKNERDIINNLKKKIN